MKISAFFLAVCLAAGFPAMEVKAADDVLENIYEEHQYKTENPDSDEAEGLFEKELKRDGITYRLSEIRTEVIEENLAETANHNHHGSVPGREDRKLPAGGNYRAGRHFLSAKGFHSGKSRYTGP